MADLNIGNSSASVVVSAKHNGSVIPQINNTYDLGTSTLKWKNIYGSLKGNADTAIGDGSGHNIEETYVKHRANGYDYNDLASYYVESATPTYYRIAFPDTSSTWAMIHLEISIRQTYSSGTSGKILIYGQWSSSSEWNRLYATTVGNLTSSIQVFASDKKYIYIKGGTAWGGITVDKMLVGDNMTNYDIHSLSITKVDTLPDIYQTATNYYGLHSGNYNDYTVTKTGGGASGTWGISVTGSSASCTGNAATATKLATARTISLTGSVTGSGTFDGSGNLSISTTTNHTHNYAGSASAGGSANSAVKLDTAKAGDSNTPVYFSGGKPVACTSLDLNTSGNAATATKLSKSEFTTDTIDNVTHSGLLYGTISSYTGPSFSHSDAMILSMSFSSGNNYGAQIALDDTTTPNMYVRNKYGSWSAWSKVLLSTNYTDYTVKKDGTGASGTWGISVTGSSASCTGNAATATKLVTARTIRTNLASTSAASFDGSANITPGVTGTLPITNGGTGATTASSARDNLGAQSKVLYGPSAPSDSTGSNGDMYVALESGDFKKDIVDLIYPVGSIYITMNSTNPSTLFGGTWEAFGQGRVLIGAGTGNDGSTSLSFTAGGTGGEYKHALTTSEIPSHTHRFRGTTEANNHSHTHTYVKATGVRGHKLTEAEIPAHTHAVPTPGYYAALSTPNTGFGAFAVVNPPIDKKDGYSTGSIGGSRSHNHELSTSSVASGSESQNHTHTFSGITGNAGSGSSHNNIQPYIVVYMWKRTA